jgi:hypothetical protein
MSQHDTNTEEPEDREIDLADPDDYHRRQRLKEIHQARQRVHKVIDDFERAKQPREKRQQNRELCHAVAMYIAELEPIIEDVATDVTLPERYPWDDAPDFAHKMGVVPDSWEPPEDYDHNPDYSPKATSLHIFRICNRVLSDVKPLITDDDADEWEV